MRPRSSQFTVVRFFDPTTLRVMPRSPSYLQALTLGLEIEPASSSNVRTSTTPEIEPAQSSNVRTSTTQEIEPASSSNVRTPTSTPEIEPASSSNVRTPTSTLEIEPAFSSNVETSSTSTQESIVSTPTHKPKLTVEMLTSVVIVEKGFCVICFEEWCKGNVVSELPCKHKFHFECVSKWLGIRATCPLCRYGYDSDDDDDDNISSDSEAE